MCFLALCRNKREREREREDFKKERERESGREIGQRFIKTGIRKRRGGKDFRMDRWMIGRKRGV